MRSKEEAHDYRYFPEPDLPPLTVEHGRVAALRADLPELPDARRRRFVEQLGLPEYDAVQLTQSRALADYFEAAVRAGATPKTVSNWMMGELTRALKEAGHDISNSPVSPERLAGLLSLIGKGTISGAIAKGVFETMFTSGRTAADIVTAEGLTQIDDESHIQALIATVMQANPDAVKGYRSGKTSTFGFLVGQVMKAAAGKANPKRVNESLKRALDALETENAK
jgi:aspartyl-tRNA(Asn)/glutamyl-tRNA(Gln) amidotransferase subunit B